MSSGTASRFGREGVFGPRKGPDGTYVEMPYSGIRTFLRRRPSLDLAGVDMAVLGIPFDLTTSGRSGSRERQPVRLARTRGRSGAGIARRVRR